MPKSKKDSENVFRERDNNNPFALAIAKPHKYGKSMSRCETDSKGFKTPKNKAPRDLVLDASEGFIPLWKENVVLRWRFSPNIHHFFDDPKSAMKAIRELFADGLMEWGDSAPVKFAERDDAWDFEINVKHDDCDYRGCTLARAFFPDGGRHELILFPKLFEQDEKEQIETLAHELGHIFGLRHFFADVKEKAYESTNFGHKEPFTIMNYGHKSTMTENDRSDLKLLYKKVWNNEITAINETRIVTFWPYHILGGIKEIV
ncbi:MAG: hypothetical protein ACI8ZM_000246 [Crocinitomix sp.]|jgi:hypothetical protein